MRNLIIFSLFIASFAWTNAQVSVGSSTNHGQWRVGGSVGLSTGNNGYFGISVLPSVGYAVSPKFEIGLNTGYQYNKNDYYKSNIFSVGPYANYYFIQNFFGRVNFEYLTGEQEAKNYDYTYDIDESALWLGAGYQSTGRIRYQIGLMYNVLYDEDDSIYNNGLRPFAGIAVSL